MVTVGLRSNCQFALTKVNTKIDRRRQRLVYRRHPTEERLVQLARPSLAHQGMGLWRNELSIRYGLRHIATLVFLLSALTGGLFRPWRCRSCVSRRQIGDSVFSTSTMMMREPTAA